MAYVYTEKQAAMTSTSDPSCNASPLRKIPSDHHEEFSPPVAADVSYVEEINHAIAQILSHEETLIPSALRGERSSTHKRMIRMKEVTLIYSCSSASYLSLHESTS